MKNPIKILYVDDEVINTQLFEVIFQDQFVVVTAEGGAEGLKVLADHRDVSAVVTDMHMPQMDGFEFIKKAKEHCPSASYYILTGFGMNAKMQDAIQSGLVKKYFSKPFDVEDISHSIAAGC